LAGAGALLLLAGVVLRLLEWAFASRPIIAVVIGAFLLDLWSQRLGARWSPSIAPPSSVVSVKRWLGGLGIGLGIGLLVVLAAAVTGSASVTWGRFSPASVAIGFVRAGAYAFRDELLFRGIPLALAGKLPRPWPVVFSSLLGVAPLALLPGARIEAMLLGLFAGLFFALVWEEGGGGLSAWASHTGWLLAIQVVMGGAVIEVEYMGGSLASMQGASGLPADLGVAAFALSGWLLFGRKKWWRD